MNKDGELACLLAYEWTPNEYKYDYGHKNVYYRGDEGEIFRLRRQGRHDPHRPLQQHPPPTRPSASPTTPPRTG